MKINVVLLGVFSFLPVLLGLPKLNSVPTSFQLSLPFPESHFTYIDQVKIHYRLWLPIEKAKGNVLLVHGFAGSTYSYRFMSEWWIKQGFRVIAVDLPGYGFSDRHLREDQLPDPVLLWALIQGIEKENHFRGTWILMGHSMGAATVAQMAGILPNRTAGLIMANGTPRLQPGNWGMKMFMSFKPATNLISTFAENYFFVEERVETLLSSGYGRSPNAAEIKGYLTPLKIPGTAQAILKKFSIVKILPEPTLPETLPQYMIWGSADKWIPWEEGEKWIATHPTLQSCLIPAAGHIPMETHPTEVQNCILNWLISHKLLTP